MTFWPQLEEGLRLASSLEERLDCLRRFQKSKTKEIEERSSPLPALFGELTALAEAVVAGSYEIRRQELTKDQPAPQGSFAIVAMGKFGGRELTYRSDLDIIYLFERQDDVEFYTRLGTRIISALTLVTREGHAYRIDAALRPSGNAGTLLSTLDAFRRYHREEGRTWERQALIKSRPILGDDEFLKEIGKTCEEIAYRPCPPSGTAAEIDRLRRRMENEIAREKRDLFDLKTGRGGIVDIEFAVQYLQLVHGHKVPAVRTQNTLDAVARLLSASIIDRETASLLETAYLFYRTIETGLRLLLDQPTDRLRPGTEETSRLEERFFKGESVVPRYLETREKVRAVYEKVFGK